jgi:hypothetical protein
MVLTITSLPVGLGVGDSTSTSGFPGSGARYDFIF